MILLKRLHDQIPKQKSMKREIDGQNMTVLFLNGLVTREKYIHMMSNFSFYTSLWSKVISLFCCSVYHWSIRIWNKMLPDHYIMSILSRGENCQKFWHITLIEIRDGYQCFCPTTPSLYYRIPKMISVDKRDHQLNSS